MTEKPLVDPHLGPAPDDLLIEEIVVGDGRRSHRRSDAPSCTTSASA